MERARIESCERARLLRRQGLSKETRTPSRSQKSGHYQTRIERGSRHASLAVRPSRPGPAGRTPASLGEIRSEGNVLFPRAKRTAKSEAKGSGPCFRPTLARTTCSWLAEKWTRRATLQFSCSEGGMAMLGSNKRESVKDDNRQQSRPEGADSRTASLESSNRTGLEMGTVPDGFVTSSFKTGG